MKISIITATFNSESTIARNLDSVKAQHYPDVEQIIIDKVSTDSTLERVREKNIPYVKVISENDSGIYDAFNKGVKRSIGDVIGFLNSDDYYLDGAFNSVIECFESNPDAAIVHGNMEVGSKVYQPLAGLFSFGGARIFHPASFIRREVFERIGFFDKTLRIASDLDFFIRARNNNYKFVHIDKRLTHFSLGGISTRNPFLVPLEIREVMQKNYYPRSEANVVFWFEVLRNIKQLINNKICRR